MAGCIAGDSGALKSSIGDRLFNIQRKVLIQVRFSAFEQRQNIGRHFGVSLQQFQIQDFMGVSAFLIETGFNKIRQFYRLDKSEAVCILEKGLSNVA